MSRKSHPGKYEDEGIEMRSRNKPCLSKNAKMARENRLRKKQLLETMDRELKELRRENRELRKTIGEQVEYSNRLKKDVDYLSATIANSGPLAKLLGRLVTGFPNNATPPMNTFEPFMSSPFDDFEISDDLIAPESSLNTDHSYSTNLLTDDRPEDVGICLHVSNKKISMEFCSICNEQSIRNSKFLEVDSL